MDKLTGLADYLQKIPAAFLVAILSVLALILFLPVDHAKTLSIDGFRDEYRVYLGPAFLFILSFCIARIYSHLMKLYRNRKLIEARKKLLHKLTPEERGYLIPYIAEQKNSVYVGLDDGVMVGLWNKKITYLPTSRGDILNGFAFNLQPWAREYLENNPSLLNEYVGQPLTPQKRDRANWW